MFIKKKRYLLLFALFAMTGIGATQGDEILLKREGNSAVILAAKKREYNTVDKLLDKESITLTKDGVNELIYWLTASNVPKNIFEKLFIQYGGMIDLTKRYNGDRGDTLFIQAAKKGNIDLLKLIKANFLEVDIDQRNNLEQTGLMFACFKGQLETVKYLIEELNATANLQDKRGYTGFMRASQRGQIAVVQYLLEQKKVKLNEQIGELKRSIKFAIKGDHSEVVSYLLQKFKGQLDEAEINDIAQYIAQCGAGKVMKVCLEMERFERILTITSKDPANKIVGSPFLHALIAKNVKRGNMMHYNEEGKLAILKLLVQKKKIDLKKKQNIVEPVGAMKNNQFAIAKYLIDETDCKVEEEVATQLFKLTATHLRTDMLETLLNHCEIKEIFSVTMKGDYNKTFLDYLVRGGMYDTSTLEKKIAMLEWLHTKKKINLNNKEGKQVILLAAESNQAQIVKKIFPKVQTKWTSEEVHQLFYVAINTGSYDVVALLLKNSNMKNAFNMTTKASSGNQEQFSCLDIFIRPVLFFGRDLLGQAKILALLVQHGKIDLKNQQQNKKIWFTACFADNQYMLQYLLKNNIVQPNVKNDKGQNGLIVATAGPVIPSLNVIKFLAQKNNINIDEKDDDHKTAYDYAVEDSQNGVIGYIKSIRKERKLKNYTEEISDGNRNYQGVTNLHSQTNQEIKINDKELSPEKVTQQSINSSEKRESVEKKTEKNALKNGENDLNERKSPNFKLIVKVVVALIGGITILVGIPYYFFTKKQKEKE